MMFSKSKIYFPLWLSELMLAPTFMGKKTLKPYATVVRSRRRGASLGGEVIPDKKRQSVISRRDLFCCVSPAGCRALQRGDSHATAALYE